MQQLCPSSSAVLHKLARERQNIISYLGDSLLLAFSFVTAPARAQAIYVSIGG
jgi:hypothetical protein